MIKKGVVSRYFHVPYNEIEEKLSIEDIEKLYCLGLHMIDIIDMAPFHHNKK